MGKVSINSINDISTLDMLSEIQWYIHNCKEGLFDKIKDNYEWKEKIIQNTSEHLEKKYCLLHYFLNVENASRRISKSLDQYVTLPLDFSKKISFPDYQTNIMQLHMGLYAFKDVFSNSLRYLFGSDVAAEEKSKIRGSLSNFQLPMFIFREGEWFALDREEVHDIAEMFYKRRTDVTIEKIDFINILNDKEKFEERRTKFEKKHQIIYAEDGEMTSIIAACMLYEANKKGGYDKQYQFPDDVEHVETGTLYDHLESLGLFLRRNGDFYVTERYLRTINWLKRYFNELLIIKTKKDSDNKGLLPYLLKHPEHGSYWLDTDESTIEKIIDILKKQNISYQKEFIAKNSLALNKEDLDSLIAIISKHDDYNAGIYKRARFNVPAHYLLRRNEYTSRSWLVFPILKYENDETKTNEYVGFFLGTIKDTDERGRVLNKNALINLIRTNKLILQCLGEVENREVFFKDILLKEIIRHGTKAAMTAIMSRNLSHNIGSHVLSYWNQELEKKLRNVSEYGEKEEDIKKSKDLFQYIQHRMDFLAEVSTSVPCSEMSLDVEHDILNPLIKPNQDKFSEESIKAGKVSILLEGLAKSEGIDSLYNKIYVDIKDLKNRGVNTRVSIPNGMIGIHAIYSVLENFIRNAAKHYKGTEICSNDDLNRAVVKCKAAIAATKEYLEDMGQSSFLNDMFKEREESCEDKINIKKIKCIIEKLHALQSELPFIKIVIKESLNPDWKEDYLVMRIWDMRENSCNLDVVNKLRKYLSNGEEYKFTTDKGQLVSGAWGIKEMITCANFLRKNKPEFLLKGYYEDKKEPPLLEILCGDNANGESQIDYCIDGNGQITNLCRHSNKYKNRFGIRLYLRKPKDLAIAVESIDKSNIKAVKFEIKKVDLPNVDTLLKEEIPHRILLVDNDLIKRKYEKDPKASCRIRVCSNITNVYDQNYLDEYKKFIEDEIAYGSIQNLRLSYYPKEMGTFSDTDYTQRENISVETRMSDEGVQDIFNGNLNNVLFFVYHLEKIANKNETLFKKCLEAPYLQPISGGYSTYVKISANHPQDKQICDHFYLELIESALTKVVIVDERISEWAKKDFTPGKKIKMILQKMKIFVADVNLRSISYDGLSNELSSDKNFNVFTVTREKIHFFVIHQGILDKIGEDNAKKLLALVECKWKVVDSGRGVPSELYQYDNVRFVEISALQKLLENFDKHGLVQTLFSVRQPENSRNKEV